MPRKLPDALIAQLAEQTVICTDLHAVMQRLVDAAGSGYTHHVHGKIEAAKLAGLIDKLAIRYPGLRRNRKHAYRLKRNGEARHKLIALYKRGHSCGWWLLTDKLDDTEQWQGTGSSHRIEVLNYKLHRITKSGASKPVWTWSLTSAAKQELKTFIQSCIRADAPQDLERLKILIDGTRFWPGFSGIRADRAELIRRCFGEWKRSKRSNIEPPEWPKLRYLQRIKTR